MARKMIKQASTHLLALTLLVAGPIWAKTTLSGKAIQGGLMTGQTTPGAKVSVDGDAVRVSADGIFLVGFGRDHPKQSKVVIAYPDGSRETQTIKVAQREYKIQRINNLPKRKVTPNKADLKRIRDDSAQAKKARSQDDDRQGFRSGWIWPVEGPISGVYGSQRILNGKPRRPHFGVDIARPTGTPVKAPADGVVTLAHPDMFFSGATLIIDHGHKLSSSFLHLSKIRVKVGDKVKQGDVVAEVGATGRVTGAHLDWRMNYYQHRIDPQLLVPPMPEQ
ncbi:MAG: M23 family metallopeptidase [Chromatiales bacterium]|nr:M23 family metallopeptidase [Chromatiales bacterium]